MISKFLTSNTLHAVFILILTIVMSAALVPLETRAETENICSIYMYEDGDLSTNKFLAWHEQTFRDACTVNSYTGHMWDLGIPPNFGFVMSDKPFEDRPDVQTLYVIARSPLNDKFYYYQIMAGNYPDTIVIDSRTYRERERFVQAERTPVALAPALQPLVSVDGPVLVENNDLLDPRVAGAQTYSNRNLATLAFDQNIPNGTLPLSGSAYVAALFAAGPNQIFAALILLLLAAALAAHKRTQQKIVIH